MANSIEILSINPNATNPCQKFSADIRVTVELGVGFNIFAFNLVVNKDTVNQEQVFFDSSDVVNEVPDVSKTFEKTIELNRAVFYPWTFDVMLGASGSYYNQVESSPFPSIWDIDGLSVNTDVNGLGTVTVGISLFSGLSAFLGIEISIDDVTYYDTNVLSGLSPGTYTLYARDVFGCQKTAGFVIGEQNSFETFNDFSFVSLLNPVPFTAVNNKRKSFTNTPSYAVDNNYLSKRNKYEYLQGENSLKFQFRSNYEVNLAYLIGCGEVVTSLQVTKKSENLNQRDNRDAKFYFENGKLHAYYDGTGNIYDNDGNVIGANQLNGTLLFNQISGEVLSIDTLGVIEITETITVEGIGQVMVLNFNQPVGNDYLKITTYYNLDNFEVYEFNLPLNYNTGDYQIIIANQSETTLDVNPFNIATYISEIITISEVFSEPKFKFVWKNSENNQFSWDTGIECYCYMPKSFEPEFQQKDENDIYTTDTTSFMLESDVYDIFLFVIERIGQITARQLMMIVSNDYLQVDDNFYVKEETPEVTRLGVSDAYNVTLTLQLASNYNSNSREGLTNNRNIVDTGGFLRID